MSELLITTSSNGIDTKRASTSSTSSTSNPLMPHDDSFVKKKKKSRIIPPDKRKKVAKACDVCKKRKQKCNGILPCELCTEKNFQCTYTGIDRRNLKPSKKQLNLLNAVSNNNNIHQQQSQVPLPPLSQQLNQDPQKQKTAGTTQSQSVLPPSLQPLFHFPLSIQPNDDDDDDDDTEKQNDMTIVSEEEGMNSRILYDTAGNLRYVGESSAGCFLPQCRKVFQKILGISKFTHDPKRFLIIDSPAYNNIRVPVSLPPREYAMHLKSLFKQNINDILYVFNEDYLDTQLFDQVFSNPLQTSPKQLCQVYVILAIGSIFTSIEIQRNIFPFPLTVFVEPNVFFDSARNILSTTPDDSNLWLVETHYLMSFYHELHMTRNTAWINLGTAIRYALALGMHRRYVNESFKDPEYALHRRKLFRSLYISDRATATHLGRSLTINDLEWDDKNALSALNDVQDEMLKVSILNGRILSKVYYNPSIGMKNALKLAVDLKIFTVNSSISKSMNLQNALKYRDNHILLILHSNHLHGIIQLSRPFFFFIILIKLNFIKFDSKSKNAIHLKNFYQSCVKASLLTIKLIESYFVNNHNPLKAYTLVSCTFHSGLILGMVLLLQSQNIDDELFDQKQINNSENSKVVCISAMKSAISILRHYAKVDPTSQRYSEILFNMLDATKIQQQTYQEFAKQLNPQEQSQPLDTQGNLSYPQAQSQPITQITLDYNNLINPPTDNYPQQSSQRFEDWLFPKMDNNFGATDRTNSNASRPHSNPQIHHHHHQQQQQQQQQQFYGISPDSTGSDIYQTDDFLKDLAGLNNNMTTSNISGQFLDDFLFNVVDGKYYGSN